MKSGDARVALIGFPSVGKVLQATVPHIFDFCFLNIEADNYISQCYFTFFRNPIFKSTGNL